LNPRQAISPSLNPRAKKLAGPAVILLAAAVAVAPLVVRGPANGADLLFHLASWFEAQHSMLLGVPYPHWAINSNLGTGEPRFVFYPPLSWMAGAALGLFFPWTFVAVVFAFLLFAATGLANRALAREVMPDGPATLAGCAAIFIGFPLLTLYSRSDFAEMLGGVWIPLLILFLLRDRNPSGRLWARAFDGSTAMLAVALAGAWLSNGPAGLMASYLLAGLAVVTSLVRRSWAPLVRATAGAALGFGLAADYLVPAAWEQHWANLQFAISRPHFWIQSNWLFAQHNDQILQQHNKSLLTYSWIAVCMIAVTLGGALVARMRGTLPGTRNWWLPLIPIPFAVLFLMLPISLPVWNYLPKLRFLQFPWRWLLVLEAPMAVFFASAVWFVPLRKRIPALAACAALFVAISAAAGAYWFVDCGKDQDLILSAEEDGWGVHGKREYDPAGQRYFDVLPRQPSACLLSDSPSGLRPNEVRAKPSWNNDPGGCGNAFVSLTFLPERKFISGAAAHAGYLVLGLRSYPAWRVTVNGQPVTPITESDYGLMAVPVPQGHVDVAVHWATTPDVFIGRWLSALALLLLTVVCLLRRWRSRPRLS
jgi:hypothetical protein